VRWNFSSGVPSLADPPDGAPLGVQLGCARSMSSAPYLYFRLVFDVAPGFLTCICSPARTVIISGSLFLFPLCF
jgi:hypothetical protein